MITGRQWSEIWQRRSRFGIEYWGSWSGRGRGHRCPDFSLKLSSIRCFSLVQRRGWLPPVWDGSWGVSNTSWHGNWWGGCHGGGRKEGGSTPQRRRRERRWGLSRWKPTFGEGGIRLRSIFQRDQFWICARRRRLIEGHRWGCGGGNRQDLTWRGKWRWWQRRQRRTRVVWYNKWGGLKRKTPGAGATATGTK